MDIKRMGTQSSACAMMKYDQTVGREQGYVNNTGIHTLNTGTRHEDKTAKNSPDIRHRKTNEVHTTKD